MASAKLLAVPPTMGITELQPEYLQWGSLGTLHKWLSLHQRLFVRMRTKFRLSCSDATQTVHGLYYVIYDSKGYRFRTPEAWDETGNFRASMYMRPADIWAMEMTEPDK